MRITLKLKLGSLFLIMLLAACLQGGMTVARMRTVDQELSRLLDQALLSLSKAEAIEALTVKVRLLQVRVATADTDAEREASRAAVEGLMTDRAAAVDAYRARIAASDEQALFDTLIAKLKTQHYDWDRLCGMALSQREAAMAYYRGAMNAHYQDAAKAAHALVERHVKTVEEAGRSARES